MEQAAEEEEGCGQVDEYKNLMQLLENSNDAVYKPAHYTDGKIEVIDFINDKGLNFNRGNIIKYVARAGKKDAAKEVEDIEKAIQYANFEIIRLTGRQSAFKVQAIHEFLTSLVNLFAGRMDEKTTVHDLLTEIILSTFVVHRK